MNARRVWALIVAQLRGEWCLGPSCWPPERTLRPNIDATPRADAHTARNLLEVWRG